MKSKVIHTTIRMVFALALAVSFNLDANAQVGLTSSISNKLILPIINGVSNNISSDLDSENNSERGFLDEGILILEENLKLCRDILSGTEDSVSIKMNSSDLLQKSAENISLDTLEKESKPLLVKPQKKKYKSYRNNPGNTQSRL